MVAQEAQLESRDDGWQSWTRAGEVHLNRLAKNANLRSGILPIEPMDCRTRGL